MPTVNGHFDGTHIVLDEPVRLAVGQRVRVQAVEAGGPAEVPRERHPWRGKLHIDGEGDDIVLDHFREYAP